MTDGVWSATPSSAGVLLHSMTSKIKKSSLPLRGARTGNTNLRYHLACRRSGRSSRCQHIVCPLTLAMRQKILRRVPVPPALNGPFAAPLFAPLSAPGTLCGCAMQLYFRFIGFMQYRLTPLNHKSVPLSSTIFHHRRACRRACAR